MLDKQLAALAVQMVRYRLPKRWGAVSVDIINAFCTVGAGALAPMRRDPCIERMVNEANTVLRAAEAAQRPVVRYRDEHKPGVPEVPFPIHGEKGSGEELPVPAHTWVSAYALMLDIPKDCFNGLVGAMDLKTHRNRVIDWVNEHELEVLVVVGICTDICVLQFVQAMLSARNHGMMPTLREIVVYEPGCTTYDLPLETARELSLPEGAAHPRELFHAVGLTLMAQSGAIIANELEY